jgi:hypothetical protein
MREEGTATTNFLRSLAASIAFVAQSFKLSRVNFTPAKLKGSIIKIYNCNSQ